MTEQEHINMQARQGINESLPPAYPFAAGQLAEDTASVEDLAAELVEQLRADAKYIRQRLAGQALVGLLARGDTRTNDQIARDAVALADAVIAATEGNFPP